MRTLDEQATSRNTLLRRLRRDVGLLWQLSRMGVQYFTTGARVRRAYRAKAMTGETYWVDE